MRVRSVALFALILLLPVWRGSGGHLPGAPTVDDLRAGVPDRVAAFEAVASVRAPRVRLPAGVDRPAAYTS